MSFQKEFERRLRRVIGQTDDSAYVSYEVQKENGYGGGCDTCGYGADDGRAYVSVSSGNFYSEFGDLGDLMRAMDEVPDDEKSSEKGIQLEA